jgi:hypothetical protein
MFGDTLLTEVERQRKYLNKLPKDYKYPLFNAREALEFQRKSGYRDTASASREIVDNAIEAHASRVDIVFDAPKDGKNLVKSVLHSMNVSNSTVAPITTKRPRLSPK